MIDQVALWIGYAVILSGAILLFITLVVLAFWKVIDWTYRRYVNFKHLREYLRWKRNGWSPEDQP